MTTPPNSHRILFVVSSLRGGGAEFVARTWMGWLAQRGHRVSVVITAGTADLDFLPPGVRTKTLGAAHGHLEKCVALSRVVRSEQPDVAIALQTHPNLLLLAAASLLPPARRPQIFISERNLVSLGLPGSSPSHRLKIAAAKILYRFSDHALAISHPVAAELVSAFGISGEKVTVVANPATAKVDLGRAIRTIRVPTPDRVQLVLACRLVEQKRPLLAVATAVELQRRGVATRIVSFGAGPLQDQLAHEAERAGIVCDFRGWVEDWFAEVDSDAVTLLPSLREGFGNVLVEAAAAGYPSVAVSGALGVADAIVPGITGEFALSADPRDLADAVQRAATLSLSGVDPWLARFSAQSSGSDLERVIEKALSTSGLGSVSTATSPNSGTPDRATPDRAAP